MVKANLAAALFLAVSAFAVEPWQSVDTTLGQPGNVVSGGIHRYGWPRTDMEVMIGAVRVEPALGLGSWAAFCADRVMGDLVLRPREVDGVIRALQSGGFEIAAIHNHLLGEAPMVVYLHYEGHGDPAALARTLRHALATTLTPVTRAAPTSATRDELAAFAVFSDILQRKGVVNGRVLQFGIPRAEAITDGGMIILPLMGVATAVNVQCAGDGVAAAGDFVLVASEVNPVVRELQAHNILVTAIHSHMLHESPRLFFLHFWGVGAPPAIAAGIKAALGKVNVAP